MGGHAPLGYDIRDRRLVVNEAQTALVRHIFERFLQVGSATKLVKDLNASGYRTKRGKPFDKGIVYKLLKNRTYVGEVEHKGTAYAGEHEAIINRDTWDKVHTILAENRHRRASRTRAATPALLKGLIFGPDDKAMAPSHTRRRGRLYRFYRSATSLKLCHDACPIRAVPAGEVEAAVINQVRSLLRAPEVVVRVWRAAQLDGDSIDECEVVEALQRLDPLWDQPPPDPYEELGQPPIDPGTPSRDVKDRIREIYIRYGRREAVEFARRQVVQMHFAGLSNDQMAEKLGVTVRTIENYKREIRRGHVEKLKNVDPGEMLGEILTHYDYHINMAWQQFLSAKTNEDRRQCQLVCLKAQADKVRFLKEWKFFDTHSYRPAVTESDNGAGRGQVETMIDELKGALGFIVGGDPDIEFDDAPAQ